MEMTSLGELPQLLRMVHDAVTALRADLAGHARGPDIMAATAMADEHLRKLEAMLPVTIPGIDALIACSRQRLAEGHAIGWREGREALAAQPAPPRAPRRRHLRAATEPIPMILTPVRADTA